MDAKQRAEYKRQRTVAIKKLREAGLSEEEIRQELAKIQEELGTKADDSTGHDSVENLPAVIDSADRHGTRGPLDHEYPEKPGRDRTNRSTIPENIARHDSVLADNPERRCVGTNSLGEPCRNFAIKGGRVCKTHGGSTRHVKEKARIRVEMASDRLMGKLIDIAYDDTRPAAVQLDAIKDSLNRAGIVKPTQVEVGPIKPHEEIFDDIATGSRAAYRERSGFVDGLDNSSDLYESGQISHRDDDGEDEHTPAPADQGSGNSWDDGASDPLSAHQRGEHREARRPQRADPPRRSWDRPAVTGDEAIRIANVANGLIDPDVYGLPPGRGY